jgi:hypothetical protein
LERDLDLKRSSILFKLLDTLDASPNKVAVIEVFWRLEAIKPIDNTEEAAEIAFKQVLDHFIIISEIVRKVESEKVNTLALADILYLIGHTYTYFTPTTSYKKFESEKVEVRRCDVNAEEKYKKNKKSLSFEDESGVIFEGKKEYETEFIWGQLIGWYKQSVDKPNASLSSDR